MKTNKSIKAKITSGKKQAGADVTSATPAPAPPLPKKTAVTKKRTEQTETKRGSKSSTNKARGTPAKRKPVKRRRRPSVSPETVNAVFSRFAEIEPEPKGELEHTDAYTLLVAVVLSAQATDAGVNKATRQLFAAADTPEKMVRLGEDRVRELIKTIGLYRNKAKNVIALSQKLIDEYQGAVPQDADALESLPGVGRKTANVVLNVWFGQPTMAVDTHVFRIAHRLGFSKGKTPEQVEADLLAIVPKEYGVPAHHWLILHGRYLCKARKPECWRCPVVDLCPYKDKTPAPRQ